MNYTIYTHEQITPATVIRPRLEGGQAEIPNPAMPQLPEGTAVVYAPDNYSRFSVNSADRTLLLSDPNGTAGMAEIMAAFPQILEAKYNALWQAAHEWEQKYISGVGLSILSISVTQQKPKALAVANWSQNLWGLYYQRKAAINIETQPDIDFTAAGSMPFSVPELSEEIFA